MDAQQHVCRSLSGAAGTIWGEQQVTQTHVSVQHPIWAVAKRDVGKLEHRRGQLADVCEGELHHRVLLDLLCQTAADLQKGGSSFDSGCDAAGRAKIHQAQPGCVGRPDVLARPLPGHSGRCDSCCHMQMLLPHATPSPAHDAQDLPALASSRPMPCAAQALTHAGSMALPEHCRQKPEVRDSSPSSPESSPWTEPAERAWHCHDQSVQCIPAARKLGSDWLTLWLTGAGASLKQLRHS